jgi:hypothetical protein
LPRRQKLQIPCEQKDVVQFARTTKREVHSDVH